MSFNIPSGMYVGISLEGRLCLKVYHGKEQPFDLQSRDVTVWSGLNTVMLILCFSGCASVHLFALNCTATG